MMKHANNQSHFFKTERRFVLVFLFLICLTLARSVHNAWFTVLSSQVHQEPGNPIYNLFTPVVGELHAPEAYRVAMPALGALIVRTLHVHDPAWVAAALDFLFAFAALLVLYWLAVGGASGIGRDRHGRLTIVLIFLTFAQFPIMWVTGWLRPETLPTCLFLAAALVCIDKMPGSKVWIGALLAITVLQSFVRADIPLILGIALAGVALGGRLSSNSTSRLFGVAIGLSVAGIAGLTQLYLQFVLHPHLKYWPTETVLQYRNNLHGHNLSTFLIALMPFIFLALFIAVKRPRIEGADAVLAIASILYLPIWYMVGSIAEIRIYVPFMMALCVLAAKTFAPYLATREDKASSGQNG